MTTLTLEDFDALVDAEEYFQFFGLEYDPQIVSVNRLHILKKFSNFMRELRGETAQMSEAETLDAYKTALQNAYNLFTTSSGVEEKLFKVFNDKPKNVVTLTQLGVK
ncbi:MAG: nitrogenase-stabilizing/protective protein NifW [Cyanobacteria bacterium P01_H01_bin.121]